MALEIAFGLSVQLVIVGLDGQEDHYKLEASLGLQSKTVQTQK